jgi:hypothetical protein
MAGLTAGIVERILGYGKNVVILNERVETLQKDMARQIDLTAQIDRRLIRLETFFEIAEKRFLERK